METAYLDLLRKIKAEGTPHGDRTGTGTTRIFGAQIRFDLNDGFPLLTTKKVPFRWVAEELLWFLSGSTYEPDLGKRGVDIWKEWATPEQCARFDRPPGELGPVYGHQWRNYGATFDHDLKLYNNDGFDQIASVIEMLIHNPNSRRIILTGWNPAEANLVALPPCHTLTQFFVSDGKLSAQLYQRSADVFLGVPFNIASYALLVHLLAHVTGLKVGEFVHTFGDVHIYSNHMDQVDEQLSREPLPFPTLTLDRKTIKLAAVDGDRHKAALKSLLGMTTKDMSLNGYKHHPAIKADVSV